MFFNLGEEVREIGGGPWGSAWRVDGFLATGRHFRHYKVRNLSPDLTQQKAVLKVVKYDPQRCAEADYIDSLRARLRRERDTLAHFSPRLPEPIDFFEIENTQDPFGGFGAESLAMGEPVLIRSLVHGASLSKLMQTRGAPPAPAEALLLTLARVCSFLDELHAGGRGWLFWEMTPDHVIVDPEQDFEPAFVGSSNFRMLGKGLAVEPDPKLKRLLTIPEPGYAAPEQLSGSPAGIQADIYNLGALLFHIFTGVDPRDLADDITSRQGLAGSQMTHEDAQAFCDELRAAIVRFCRRNMKGLGIHRARVRQMILRSLSPDPSERFESPLELRDAILASLTRSMPVAWPE